MAAYRRVYDSRHLQADCLHRCADVPRTGISSGTVRHRQSKEASILWSNHEETVSGSGISLAICKSVPSSRQINLASTPPLSFFYRPGALPAAQTTASEH